MNHEKRDTSGTDNKTPKAKGPGPDTRHGPGPEMMSAGTLVGNGVFNQEDESVGDIKEIMLDMRSGNVSYAVMSFGGFLGMGDKLFAVPWKALKLDTGKKRFVLNVQKDRLKDAPGFDKDHWPNMADQTWAKTIHSYYGTKPNAEDARA